MDGKLQILILEDKRADYELMLIELNKTGYELTTEWSSSKSNFIQAFDKFTPDLLLADYSLPGFDGLTAMKMARQRFGEIPVIVVSGAIGEERAIEALKAGATDYVLKQRIDRLSFAVIRAIQEAEQLGKTKRAEHELLMYAERFKRIFDSHIYGVMIGNFDGTILEANDYYLNIIGYTRQELYEKSIKWSELTAPEYQSQDNEAIEELRNSGSSIPMEKQYVTKSGARVWILLARTLLSGTDQQFLAFVLDISDRKHAQEKLLVSNATLERSRNWLEHLTETTPDIIFIYDIINDHIIYANKQVETILGYTVNEFKCVSKMSLEYPDDLEKVMAFYNSFDGDKKIQESIHRIIHKDGHYRWIQVRAVQFEKTPEGKTAEVIGVIRDITEIRKYEQDLHESENRLKILNENLENVVVQRTEQVRALSKALTESEYRERKRFSLELHENLQQILLGTKMHLNVHLMGHQQKNSAHEQDFEITESIKLLDKALHITKSMSLELNPPILKTQGLYAALSWLSSHVRVSYGLKINLVMDQELKNIKDEIQLMLTQMVKELLINVVKHSGVLEATVEAIVRNNAIQVIVSDSGKGFDIEATRKKSEKGNKLGLFTIKERLKLFGGKFALESEPGSGTRCTISVPAF